MIREVNNICPLVNLALEKIGVVESPVIVENTSALIETHYSLDKTAFVEHISMQIFIKKDGA